MRYFWPLAVIQTVTAAGGLILLSYTSPEPRPEFRIRSDRCNGLYDRGEVSIPESRYPITVEFSESMYEEDVRSLARGVFGIEDSDIHFDNCGKPSKKKARSGAKAV